MHPTPIWKPILVALVALLSVLQALPSLMGGVPAGWPKWLPSEVIQRGLDLQGGVYLLMHVDVDKAVEQTAENLVDEARGVMRDKKILYRGVERRGSDRVMVKLSASVDAENARKLLADAISTVDIEVNPQVPDELLIVLSEAEKTQARQFAVDQGIQIIRSRIDQFGVSEPSIQKQGEERILLQFPGMSDSSRIEEIIGRTARLEFKLVDEKGDLNRALQKGPPPGDVILYEEKPDPNNPGQPLKIPHLLKSRNILTGDRVQDARVNFDSRNNEPYVGITFDRLGAKKFGDITTEHVNERMAIVMDGRVYSDPVIREPILGGRATITGNFTPEESHDLAIILRSGALPAPVSIMEKRTVGPTLGSDSVKQGLSSILIGAAFVLLFMLLYYKGFGMLANLAVVLNIVILMAVLASLQATLTLPGIAGAVLLVGMAVDANVLIFERIREETRLGKTPLAAIDHGYDRAFSTIVDANITTLITAIILFQFGTGPVKGFAVTLSIGIVASMFTAIFVTRVILSLYLKDKKPTTLSI